MSKCFKHNELNDIPSLQISRKSAHYFINVTDDESLQNNNTVITAMCGAAKKSCDDIDEQRIARLLYSFKLVTVADDQPIRNKSHSLLVGPIFIAFFVLLSIFL